MGKKVVARKNVHTKTRPINSQPKKKVKKKKRKIRLRRVLIFLACLILLGFLVRYIASLPIRNIYVKNNTYLKEQEIIELVEIENYPSYLKTSTLKAKRTLLEHELIKSAKVYRRGFGEFHIDIEEYRPLFVNRSTDKVILENGNETNKITNTVYIPVLINYVPDTIYQKFITEMNEVEEDILEKISEIEYKPNDVDENRFLLSMTDGNYVYLNLYKFEIVNKYIEMIKVVGDKKGILYLDSGQYFDILE